MTPHWPPNLHRSQRGAVAPLMILLFVFFGYMVVMVLNTGQVVTDKTHVQNGADAAAILHADWTARSLNVMAMNNVALTQSLVALVAAATVTEAALDLGQRAVRTAADINMRRMEVCGGFWPCHVYYFAKMEPAIRTTIQLVEYEERFDPIGGMNTARATIEALNHMNDALADSLPSRVGSAASAMLALNDIDSVYYHQPCTAGVGTCRGSRQLEGSDLPIDRNSRVLAFVELCDAAEKGSNGLRRLNFDRLGYRRDHGPLTDGGSTTTPHVRDYISRETGLGLIYQEFWMAYPFPDPTLGTNIPPLYSSAQTLFQNDFMEKFDRNWKTACTAGALGGLASGLVGSVLPTPYQLKGQLLSGLGPSRFDSTPDFQILAVAARRYRSRLHVNLFQSAMRTDYAYGEAWVFNPLSFDLYTQDWQALLSPASHMNQPTQVLQQMQSRSTSDFSELVSMMQRAGNVDAFRSVNTH